MAEQWFDSPDGPATRTIRGTSDTAIVAFSALHLKPGHFHFFSMVEHFPKPTKLLVRDPAESWYNAGLPEVGRTLEEIAAWIKHELAAAGAKRVITVGPSMGGYAAILFGCMIGADRAIGLVPQTLLDRNLRWFVPPADVEVEAPDLRPVMMAAPRTKVDLVIGADGILDAFHALRVATVPGARILRMPQGKHSLVVDLDVEGRLWPLLGELLDGALPDDCEVMRPVSEDAVQRLYEGVTAWNRRDLKGAIESLAPVAERYPSWPVFRAALARAIARQNGQEEPRRTGVTLA